jgi:hypothetical protein
LKATSILSCALQLKPYTPVTVYNYQILNYMPIQSKNLIHRKLEDGDCLAMGLDCEWFVEGHRKVGKVKLLHLTNIFFNGVFFTFK